METFKLKYFETLEHFQSDAGDFINDTYYTIEGVISRAEDLMYRKMYFRIEAYREGTERPIYIINQSKFNRKTYKETKNK